MEDLILEMKPNIQSSLHCPLPKQLTFTTKDSSVKRMLEQTLFPRTRRREALLRGEATSHTRQAQTVADTIFDRPERGLSAYENYIINIMLNSKIAKRGGDLYEIFK